MTHNLKTWPVYFGAVVDGSKTFEVRHNDRNYVEGDILMLHEFEPCGECKGTGCQTIWDNYVVTGSEVCAKCKGVKGKYTERSVMVRVLYLGKNITGVNPDYCVMSIRIIG